MGCCVCAAGVAFPAESPWRFRATLEEWKWCGRIVVVDDPRLYFHPNTTGAAIFKLVRAAGECRAPSLPHESIQPALPGAPPPTGVPTRPFLTHPTVRKSRAAERVCEHAVAGWRVATRTSREGGVGRT